MRRRPRRGRRAGNVLALVGMVAIVASGGLVAAWTGGLRANPPKTAAQTAAAAEVDPTLAMQITRAKRDAQTCCRHDNGSVVVLPVSRCADSNGEAVDMSICNEVFRPVCCRRADSTPYWATAQWCDDIGAMVEDSLCEEQAKDICCEYPASSSADEDNIGWVTRDECKTRGGQEKIEDRCASLLENVCCEYQGRVSETMRRECKASTNHREVDATQCEPVCCHHQKTGTQGWESRANCGGKNEAAAILVNDGQCDEVCCQMTDRSLSISDRRDCATRGGTVKSIVDCGTTVTVQKPEMADTEVFEKPKGTFSPPARSAPIKDARRRRARSEAGNNSPLAPDRPWPGGQSPVRAPNWGAYFTSAPPDGNRSGADASTRNSSSTPYSLASPKVLAF